MKGYKNWDKYPAILRTIILVSSRYETVPQTLKYQLQQHLEYNPENQKWVDEAKEIYL